MGNLLVAPITNKETHRGKTEDGLEYGVSTMQGWRVHMEDAHITEGILYAVEVMNEFLSANDCDEKLMDGTNVITSSTNDSAHIFDGGCNTHLHKKAKVAGEAEEWNNEVCNADLDRRHESSDLRCDENIKPPSSASSTKCSRIKLEGHSLFAVYDGHGGSFAAEYAGLNFVRVLSKQPAFIKYGRLINGLAMKEAMFEKNSVDVSTTDATEGVSNSINSISNSSHKELSPLEQAQIHREGLELLEIALKDAFLDIDREIWREVHGLGNSDSKLPDEKVQKKENNSGEVDEGNGDGIHNNEVENEDWQQKQDSGTTATVVLLTPHWILCANAGDSRSVSSKQGNCSMPLSYDHKPDDEEEERRIYDAGGFVRAGRVEGDLAVSRGLGDFRFKVDDIYEAMGTLPVSYSNYDHVHAGKKIGDGNDPISTKTHLLSPSHQKVSPIPDIIIQKRNVLEDEFVILACDGIFDVQTNHECIALAADIFREGESDVGLLCEEMLDTCLERGSKDNMTALVVKFPAQTVGQGGGVLERRRTRVVVNRSEESSS